MTSPAIRLESVTLAYPSKPNSVSVMEDFNLLLPPGKIHVIMGANGCGKSTLLKLILGASMPQKGSVSTRKPADEQLLNCDWIPQDFRNALFPWKSVRENLLPWALNASTKSETANDFEMVVELLGLGQLLNRFPSDLSGGQQQRAIIGRVLLSQPDLLVMDEPFSAMDEQTKEALMDSLRQIWTVRQPTVVVALHEPSAAARLADLIWLFHGPPLTLHKSIERTAVQFEVEQMIREQFSLLPVK